MKPNQIQGPLATSLKICWLFLDARLWRERDRLVGWDESPK